MATSYVAQTNALIDRVAARDLFPYAIRLLADGEPVAVERLAAAAGWPVEGVEVALDAQTSAERDDQGRLVGLALTLRRTPHRFTVDGRRLFARADTCVHGHFFSSTGATTSWSEAHPDGHVLTVAEAFRLDREVIGRLGWEASTRRARSARR